MTACWLSEDWNEAEIVDGECACGCGTTVVCACSPGCDGE